MYASSANRDELNRTTSALVPLVRERLQKSDQGVYALVVVGRDARKLAKRRIAQRIVDVDSRRPTFSDEPKQIESRLRPEQNRVSINV